MSDDFIEDLAYYEEEIADLRWEIERLEKELAEARAEADRWQDLSDKADKTSDYFLGQKKATEASLTELRAHVWVLRGALECAIAQLNREADSIKDYPFELHEVCQRMRAGASSCEAVLSATPPDAVKEAK